MPTNCSAVSLIYFILDSWICGCYVQFYAKQKWYLDLSMQRTIKIALL
jgi:hypothetical protein